MKDLTNNHVNKATQWAVVVRCIEPGDKELLFSRWGDTVRETKPHDLAGSQVCDLESSNWKHPDWVQFSRGGQLPYGPGYYEGALPFSDRPEDVARYNRYLATR